jgi:filamentous hemagglutinin
MEHPFPGAGGRHRATFTYGTKADAAMSHREALAAGIWDARRIYRASGQYGSYVREQLQCVIDENVTRFPNLFEKTP